MNKKKNKKYQPYVDDGHTIYSMEGLAPVSKSKDNVGLNKKEKWAAIKAAFAHFFPIFIGILICFSLTMLLIYFWLK